MRGFLKSYSKPKITALITSYNSEQYIGQAIRSVQNQRMEDIEILIIDDNSKDNILKAKGKYTMLLDGDDLFINEDLFNICFFEAIKSSIDISYLMRDNYKIN